MASLELDAACCLLLAAELSFVCVLCSETHYQLVLTTVRWWSSYCEDSVKISIPLSSSSYLSNQTRADGTVSNEAHHGTSHINCKTYLSIATLAVLRRHRISSVGFLVELVIQWQNWWGRPAYAHAKIWKSLARSSMVPVRSTYRYCTMPSTPEVRSSQSKRKHNNADWYRCRIKSIM